MYSTLFSTSMLTLNIQDGDLKLSRWEPILLTLPNAQCPYQQSNKINDVFSKPSLQVTSYSYTNICTSLWSVDVSVLFWSIQVKTNSSMGNYESGAASRHCAKTWAILAASKFDCIFQQLSSFVKLAQGKSSCITWNTAIRQEISFSHNYYWNQNAYTHKR